MWRCKECGKSNFLFECVTRGRVTFDKDTKDLEELITEEEIDYKIICRQCGNFDLSGYYAMGYDSDEMAEIADWIE